MEKPAPIIIPDRIQVQEEEEGPDSGDIKPILERSNLVANEKFKKAASLVAQLVQVSFGNI